MSVTCTNCGSAFRLEPDLNYLDMGRNTWILAKPSFALGEWGAVEENARETFADAFGTRAPAAAQDLGSALEPRLTFGWPAFREKLVAREAGLDDVVLEETKLAIIRFQKAIPADEGLELRLDAVAGDFLQFAWVETAGGAVVEAFQAPKSLYEAVRHDAGWNDVGQELTRGLFIDIQRLFIPPSETDETQPDDVTAA